MKKFIVKEFIILTFISLLYFGFTLINLEHVGVSTDEMSLGLFGVNILGGQDLNTLSEVSVNLFGIKFPTNIHRPYTFQLPAYMLLPFFIVFGLNMFAFKFASIFYVWLSLLFLYYIVKNLFNWKIAFLTLLLLVTSTIFIHFSRVSLNLTEPYLNFFFWGSIFFYILYKKNNKNLMLYMSMLFIGCGFSVKLSILARVLGILVLLVLFYRRPLESIKTTSLKKIIFSILFFMLGSSLFLYYNIISHGKTFKLMTSIKGDKLTMDGVDNSNFLQNLKLRQKHVKMLLEEEFDIGDMSYSRVLSERKIIPARDLLLKIFTLALVFNPLYLLFIRKADSVLFKCMLFVYVYYLTAFIVSCFTPGSLTMFHMALMYPFPQLVIAIFLYSLTKLISAIPILSLKIKKYVSLAVSGLVFMMLLFVNVQILYAYHNIYHETGGRFYWSGYIEQLISYIEKNDLNPSFVINWGIDDALSFLTYDRNVNINDEHRISLAINKSDFYQKMEEGSIPDYLESKPGRVYFIQIIDPNDLEDERILWLEEYAGKYNKKLYLHHVIANKVDYPVYAIYRLE